MRGSDAEKPIVFSPGAAPGLLQDLDNFSEIDLHSSSEPLSSVPTSTVEYNPLQELEEAEVKGTEPSSYLQQTSAITAQFAAQLPNVASTVFSTFSRVIKGTSPQPTFDQPPVISLIDPASASQTVYDYSEPPAAQIPSFAVTQQEQGPPPPPPTFFNPVEISNSGVTQPPPVAPAASNSYRLGGSKKKTYAHIPGLSAAGPSPTVEAPVQNPCVAQLPSAPESPVTYHPNLQQIQPPKSSFSFLEKLPNLLEKLPVPAAFTSAQQQQPDVVPTPTDYFSSQAAPPSAPGFGEQPPPSIVQPVVPEAPVAPFQQPANQQHPANLPPPPTFFTPAQIPTIPNHPQTQPSKNPYSSSRLNRGSVGLYKNPLTSPAPIAAPVFLQEPPKVATNFPQPVAHIEPTSQPPVQFFNPTISTHQVKPPKTHSPTSRHISESPSAGTDQVGTVISRPQSSLSESLGRSSNPFTPFQQDTQSETKTVIDSRSKSSENVLSPPPRPNSNLSEPAIYSEITPLSDPGKSIEASVASTLASNNYPSFNTLNSTQQVVQPSVGSPIPAPTADPLPPTASSFFNSSAAPQQQPGSLPPPPVTGGISGCKPYNLQKTRRSAYTVPPSLDQPTAAPCNLAFNTHPELVQPQQYFSSPFAQTQPFYQPLVQTIVPTAPAVFFNPPAVPQQSVHPPLSSTTPIPFFNLAPNQPQQTIVASFFNSPAQDRNANPVPQSVQPPLSFASVPPKSLTPISNPQPRPDINSNPANPLPNKQQARPSSAVSNYFFTEPTRQEAPADVLNANFANLPNPIDFFNTTLPTVQHPTAKTGQSQSQVQLFNLFSAPAPGEVEVVDAPEQTELSQADQQLPSQSSEPQHPASSGFDQEEGTSEEASAKEENEELQTNQLNEESPIGGNQTNVVNDNQLDDQYDDPVEQERIGNAPEPIFSSDNLFEFKKSPFEDDTFSKDVLVDANSSSMAAMTATAAAATGGAASAAVESSMASINETTNIAYRPVYRHWFYRRGAESKITWCPFSMNDSLALEDALALVQDDDNTPTIIAVDGGRHDVSIKDRKMSAVYWRHEPQEVRRCSWFYKNLDSKFIPYEEEVAELLEREYKEAATSGEWQRRVTIPNGETVVFHGPSVIVHFLRTQNPDAWASSSPVASTTNRPRVVKRGVDEFNIDDGEPDRVDHLLFMVHGIGEACDLKFRSVEEVVDEFRSISAQLVQSHYRSSVDRGDVGRVEVLPISWHNDLHSEESGIDKKLKAITLESIPKLRNFTNDTVLDVLFYTSPMFCQNIIDAVGNSLNRLYLLFCERNPSFKGGVSLAGHSLGSLILFDLLCHQKPQPMETENSENPDADRMSVLRSIHPKHRPLSRKCSQQINYEVGPAGTGQPYITYPQLAFQPKKFFALGSPIGMFVTVRGIDALGLDFKLPTCDGFFNIFHPYDPVAYRVEALVNQELRNVRPVLIPHHKGRKRMHLELKETMVRVGTDLKQKVLDTFRNTLDAVYAMTSLNRPDTKAIESEVDKVIKDQLKFETSSSATTVSSGDLDTGDTDLPMGQLNQSRRIDYVLQEAPLEFFNEYLFALTSHVCYWESEDTMLFLMKEIYTSMGVQSDSKIPQQSMTIERPIASPTPSCNSHSNYNLFPQHHQQQQPDEGNR
ncbi:uncharacterized protein LOC129765744 isoform X2 [Toxorhynchites rutilus septentrionalis]|uniref:uncharacterized protein LOC129765744 isoform X2 n=1 Tax=Toxorhynchites rutilus septentrionalis TaxID=329112 RepID=UPI00247A2206|nr:uncharacterized protein LOC129765744 isoform X2 [Toxorhynchites rutilus septentrionalis]